MGKKKMRFLAGLNEGALSRQLGIPTKDDIPRGLLDEINSTPIGRVAHNPMKTGNAHYRVTRLMKNRSVLARNMKRW